MFDIEYYVITDIFTKKFSLPFFSRIIPIEGTP